MDLHKKIKEIRIQEICDKYIDDSVNDKKPISEKDLAYLSCAELIVLYFNTEWLVERSSGESVDICLNNQITLMDLIKKRLQTDTLYVIYNDSTHLPFMTENKSILVYTEKRVADMIACSFNVEYFKESIRFTALEVSENKEQYWNKLRAAGISKISVDGTKFTLKTDELVNKAVDYENTEFCKYLIHYAQASRLGIHKDKIPLFQDAILNALTENPRFIMGSVVKKDKNEFLQLYVNDSAVNQTTAEHASSTVSFHDICDKINNNSKISGIIFNPDCEHIVLPRSMILKVYSQLLSKKNINLFGSEPKMEICVNCKAVWKASLLNDDLLCPLCVSEAKSKHSSPKDSVSTSNKKTISNTQNKTNTSSAPKKPQLVYKPLPEKDYATWCLTCGIISLFILFVSILTFDNASKAIKQAKAKGEAVPNKVLIGVSISVISILFFIFFMFLPVVLD